MELSQEPCWIAAVHLFAAVLSHTSHDYESQHSVAHQPAQHHQAQHVQVWLGCFRMRTRVDVRASLNNVVSTADSAGVCSGAGTD
jgi:hypothetical protein